ncbi:MAG: biotin transporter BioY [Elusimicrobia bacterium]|nr:biotin transporter BioY [Elusimicrobiota bacterium]
MRTLKTTTLAWAFWPRAGRAESWALSGLMSLVIALCAQFEVRLPWTPVPITGGTLGVLYAGALLGPRAGVRAVALYLLAGSLGLPVFAGGAAGVHHFLGPTGGYLIGFLPGAWLAGVLAERGWDRDPFRALALMLASSSVIFLFGLLGLSRFVPFSRLLSAGLLPFIPGDLAKSCLSAALLPLGWKLVGRSQNLR